MEEKNNNIFWLGIIKGISLWVGVVIMLITFNTWWGLLGLLYFALRGFSLELINGRKKDK